MKKLLLTLAIFSCFISHVQGKQPGTYHVDIYGNVTIGSKIAPKPSVNIQTKLR